VWVVYLDGYAYILSLPWIGELFPLCFKRCNDMATIGACRAGRVGSVCEAVFVAGRQ